MAKSAQKSINGVWLKASGVSGIPQIDYDRYRTELDELDYSEEEAIKLIETLHAIANGFADIAFKVSATQTACGQSAQSQTPLPKSASGMLKSSLNSKENQTSNNGTHLPFAGSHR